ncbi:MAG: hypothetical protein ABSG84_06835 [Acidobacteriaceae bacterium]|jgi:hypothetical protein
MKSRELPVKLSRVILLFGIVSASIIAFAILVVAFLLLLPAADAIGWHLRHGNNVAFAGHTFHLPLMWTATSEPYWKSLEIERAYGGGYIGLTATGDVLDSAATHAWQEERIATFNQLDRGPVETHESGHILHDGNLEFVCVGTNNRFPGTGTLLDCRISNTDLTALISSDAKHHNEMQSILDTSK